MAHRRALPWRSYHAGSCAAWRLSRVSPCAPRVPQPTFAAQAIPHITLTHPVQTTIQYPTCIG